MARFKIEYGGEILFDEEIYDAEYTNSLEAQNAAQDDIISDLNAKLSELEEEMSRVKDMLNILDEDMGSISNQNASIIPPPCDARTSDEQDKAKQSTF